MGARCTAGQVDRLRDWINQHDDEFKTLKKNMEANSSQQQPLAIASTADQPSIRAAAAAVPLLCHTVPSAFASILPCFFTACYCACATVRAELRRASRCVASVCGVLQLVCLATVRQEVKAKNHKMENKKVKDSKKKERLTTLVQVNTQEYPRVRYQPCVRVPAQRYLLQTCATCGMTGVRYVPHAACQCTCHV